MNGRFKLMAFVILVVMALPMVGRAVSNAVELDYAYVGETLVAGFEINSAVTGSSFTGVWLVDGEVVSTQTFTGSGESRLVLQAAYVGKKISFEIRGADLIGGALQADNAVKLPLAIKDASQTLVIDGLSPTSGTSYSATVISNADTVYTLKIKKSGTEIVDYTGVTWNVSGTNAKDFTWDSSTRTLSFSRPYGAAGSNAYKVNVFGVTSDSVASDVDLAVNVVEIGTLLSAMSNQSIAYSNGATFQATYTGGNGGAILYSSGDTNVATVDASTGLVSLMGVGTATITIAEAATDASPAQTATFTVTVTKGADTGTLAYTPAIGAKVTTDSAFIPTITGADTTGSTVAYVSGNTAVATVNSSTGEITLVGVGQTVIIATKTNPNYDTQTAIYALNVKGVDQNTLAYTPAIGAKVTTDIAFIPTITGADTTGSTVAYVSGNTAVATVNSSTGEITLVGVGQTVITATKTHAYYNTQTATYTLTVAAVDPNTLAYSPAGSTVQTGTAAFAPTLLGADTAGATVTYDSSDTSVATVDANGQVTLASPSTTWQTVITAHKTHPDYEPQTAQYTLEVIPVYGPFQAILNIERTVVGEPDADGNFSYWCQLNIAWSTTPEYPAYEGKIYKRTGNAATFDWGTNLIVTTNDGQVFFAFPYGDYTSNGYIVYIIAAWGDITAPLQLNSASFPLTISNRNLTFPVENVHWNIEGGFTSPGITDRLPLSDVLFTIDTKDRTTGYTDSHTWPTK